MTKSINGNIYDYIRKMKSRPDMFTTDKSLFDIERFLHGYIACLDIHHLKETIKGRSFDPADFSQWLWDRFSWSGSQGFAQAISDNSSSRDEAFERFFELVEAYRTEDQ